MGLLDIFLKKQKEIENLIEKYLELWKECIDSFYKAMTIYIENGINEEFDFWVIQTHKKESLADDIRREIEWEMYSKALLPESRGDILGFLENIDRIPSKAQTVLYQIQLERINFPTNFMNELKKIIDISVNASFNVLEIAKKVFNNEPNILKLTHEIDQMESQCDHIERFLINEIFNPNFQIEGWNRIIFRDLIISIGDISDIAENIADRLTIISVKRRV